MTRTLTLVFVLLATLCIAAAQETPIFDETIKPLYFETLTYPVMARIMKIQGVVVLRVNLGEDGKVVSSIALSGPKELIPVALENAKKWLFRPTPERTVLIIYQFRIDGLCNLPCTSQFTFRPPNVATITTGEAVIEHAGQIERDGTVEKK